MDHLKIVAIHQPNLFPWLGYFHKIAKSHTFVFLDDVQIQKTGSSYTNRVSIASRDKPLFVTAPIRRPSGYQRIDETEFVDRRWIAQTLKTLSACYGKARCFSAERDAVFEWIGFETDNLADYNIHFISRLAGALGLEAEFVRSSKLDVQRDDPTERLVALVQASQAGIYLSGNGAVAYQDAALFESAGLRVQFIDNSRLQYAPSAGVPFTAGLSVLDAIFHIGTAEVARLLKAA